MNTNPAGLHRYVGATQFSLLGPIRAWRGGTELTIGSPQQRTVLALLLLREGGLITTDELVDAIWGERPPRTAVTTIRTYISRLRQILGATPDPDAPQIIAIGGGYQLRTHPYTVDLWHFLRHTAAARGALQQGNYETAAVRLESALDLYRGKPLTGASGPLIDAQRDRLSNLMSAATQEQLSVEVARGRHTEAIPGLITSVTRHPFHEQLRELLMLALYRGGRQAEALAQFRVAQRILSEELGIDPGPGLRLLHQRILAGDPDLLGAGTPDPMTRDGKLSGLRPGRSRHTAPAAKTAIEESPCPRAGRPERQLRPEGRAHRAAFRHRQFAVKQVRPVS